MGWRVFHVIKYRYYFSLKTLLFQNTASGRFSVGSDGTLRIERVQLGDAGQYECEAINGLGSAKALSRLDVKGKGHSLKNSSIWRGKVLG